MKNLDNLDNLERAVRNAAAKLWGKPVYAIRLQMSRELHRAEVWSWVNDSDPDFGIDSREVRLRAESEAVEADNAEAAALYRADLLHALLDVLEGDLRRQAAKLAVIHRMAN